MDFLGDDIKLNENDDLQINIGSGDFSTASGIDCMQQDIIEEFKFSYFDDPDHPERGNKMMTFINADADDPLVAIEMKQEAKSVLSRDPRVKKNSVIVSEAVPGADGYISVSFETITGNRIENLVVPISSEVKL